MVKGHLAGCGLHVQSGFLSIITGQDNISISSIRMHIYVHELNRFLAARTIWRWALIEGELYQYLYNFIIYQSFQVSFVQHEGSLPMSSLGSFVCITAVNRCYTCCYHPILTAEVILLAFLHTESHCSTVLLLTYEHVHWNAIIGVCVWVCSNQGRGLFYLR